MGEQVGMTDGINWGPTGKLVYERTYARTRPDGTKETWPETVSRVVDGNLGLVDPRYVMDGEREELIRLISEFKLLPAGRHLWASGVKGAQHLFNCWVSGWTENPSDHFEFTFMRLMEGGGVGANYSNRGELSAYPVVPQDLVVDIVCDPEHPDYAAMLAAGIISNQYHPDWVGSYQIEDSREGWAAALADLVDTHYRDEVKHFHRVYDVSRVRPAGSRLRTFGGAASGPLPLAQMLLMVNDKLSWLSYNHRRMTGMDAMEIDHAIATCVVAGGVRRSARMSMMHWNDEQVMDFLSCKRDSGKHWTTNISVEVDDRFWKEQPLQAKAAAILRQIAKGMVNNGEPGFWDSSLANVGEPNRVNATNPCGEICLEDWEPCNLGHINLQAFARGNGRYDSLDLIRAHKLMTRFLIRATYGQVSDPKSRTVLDRNRRIGVGHTGVAGFLALTGRAYSDAEYDTTFKNFLREHYLYVSDAAAEYCHQLRIPVPVKLTTVAPTGTISKLAGVSEGIHPIFARYFNRRVRFNRITDHKQIEQLIHDGVVLEDDLYAPNTDVAVFPTKDSLLDAVETVYGRNRARHLVQGAHELELGQMLMMQAIYQQYWADNAVSFTANIEQGFASDKLSDIIRVYGGRLKGATVFPDASMPQAPYERITEEEYEAAATQSVADGVDENCANGACPIK